MSIFSAISDNSREKRLRGTLCACGCLLAAQAVGAAFSAAESLFALRALQLEFWRCLKCVCQALAVLAAARKAGLTRCGLGLCRPVCAGTPVICAFAAAALAFGLLAPSQSGAGTAPTAAAFVRLCLTAPLAEELIFRGAVQGALSAFGAAAVLVQAAAFALLHGSPAQMLYALIMGTLLGLLRRSTGSLLAGSLLHCLNNAAVFILFAAYK